jgi:predicted amidophosphoribosyltransferase
LIRSEHAYLTHEDECHYLWEWTKGGGYQASATNQFIANLKMKTDQRGTTRYRYKERAIITAADALRAALNPEWLRQAALVPVPPSACRTDPEYDARMVQVLRQLGPNLDVRELVTQIESMVPSHVSGTNRATPQEIAANYLIDEAQAEPAPTIIGVFDDILTAGAHFRAMQGVLQARFPHAQITGVFLARRIFPQP